MRISPEMQSVQKHWDALWDRRHVISRHRAEAFRRLCLQYMEPGRCFHVGNLVLDYFDEFEGCRSEAKNEDALEAALLYLHAINDPDCTDNKERSADLAFYEISKFDDKMFARTVRQNILATTGIPTSLDQKLLCDIELSVFGKNWLFVRNSLNRLRAEYAHISGHDFVDQRNSYLRTLEKRPFIYWTPAFRKKYEKTARANIRACTVEEMGRMIALGH